MPMKRFLPWRSTRQTRSRSRKHKQAANAPAMAAKSPDGPSELSKSKILSLFINDFTDSDNEASALVWAWTLKQNPHVKGIYLAEPRWVDLGYYMTSSDFGRCIYLVGKLEPRIEGGDPPLTTVLAGRMTQQVIDSSKIDGKPLSKEQKDLLKRCIKPHVTREDNWDDSIKHARLVGMDYYTTMRDRCKHFDAYIDVSSLNHLEDPINLKTHYHDELVARTAEELHEFRDIMLMPTEDEKEIGQRKNKLSDWYTAAIHRKEHELGGECPLQELKSYDLLRDEIRSHDKTIAFGGASLTALQEILKAEPSLGKKIDYYQQGGTFNSKLNILGNPYNFALNTDAAKYVFDHHHELATFKLIPTDTTKKVEWTIQGLAKLSQAVGVRSLAFHGRYDPWQMISDEEKERKSTKTDEFMAWRAERVSDPEYSSPDSKGYKAVMADLTAFLAAFTEAFKDYKTKGGGTIITQYSKTVTMANLSKDSGQMVLRDTDEDKISDVECLMLSLPPGQDTVLVEDALELVKTAMETPSTGGKNYPASI